ncbi:MAG: hypothetical protein J6Y78_11250 [Paludibacteraceae bacterium]|nr:hypothetical protein [Paludibacteraceae bacterium]
MSEKRFIVEESENQLIIYDNDGIDDYYHLGNDESDVKAICGLLNEQQATISQLEKNFDDLVKWASEIAKRNVILDEQIGQLQRENEQLEQEIIIYKKAFQEQVQRCTL